MGTREFLNFHLTVGSGSDYDPGRLPAQLIKDLVDF